MKFKIPFTFSGIDRQVKSSRIFLGFARKIKKESLKNQLENANIKISPEEYTSIAIKSFVFSFILIIIIGVAISYLKHTPKGFVLTPIIAIICASFILFNQLSYPGVYDKRRSKDVDRNLIPALEDILIQLNSGVPLFNILSNISDSEYSTLSEEFKKAVSKINAGFPEIEVLEELGEKNSSVYFKRVLWQMSNGMRAGSDISLVIKESVKSLNEEQVLQIQNYGNKLNPLIMFYMLVTVIIPALSITFLTILSSMMNIPKEVSMMLFIGLFVGVMVIQTTFLGIVKSIKPSLL